MRLISRYRSIRSREHAENRHRGPAAASAGASQAIDGLCEGAEPAFTAGRTRAACRTCPGAAGFAPSNPGWRHNVVEDPASLPGGRVRAAASCAGRCLARMVLAETSPSSTRRLRPPLRRWVRATRRRPVAGAALLAVRPLRALLEVARRARQWPGGEKYVSVSQVFPESLAHTIIGAPGVHGLE